MFLSALAFLLGIMTLLWFSQLPSLLSITSILFIIIVIWYFSPPKLKPLWQYGLFVSLGSGYAIFYAQQLLVWQLPDVLENKTITITGVITTLPQITQQQVQFELALRTLNGQPQHTKLRLALYFTQKNTQLVGPFRVGDTWQMQVRLKRPHGLANPGSFDYEKWLFSQGIRATGYILVNQQLKCLKRADRHYFFSKLRENLQYKLQKILSGQDAAGMIIALVMGAQKGITQNQWEIMRATGTNHLMAIAGVHIGFVAGFFYGLVNMIWRRSEYLTLRFPAKQAAAVAALLTAILYSALAGFSLPTWRALVMTSVLLSGSLLNREVSTWHALAVALFIVLILEPLSVLTVSFWLSFGAVFAILYGTTFRLHSRGIWWKYGRVQWVITLGLLPICLVLFEQASLVSFVANLIAIPAVGILVLPLCLSGTVLLLVIEPLGHLLLLASAQTMLWVEYFLGWLANFPAAIWYHPTLQLWILIASIVGIVLILAPAGVPGRWLGLGWLLPLIYTQPASPKEGEIWLTLLDVGQGLSAVIQTQSHNLLFDAGPKMGHEDAGRRVVVPFLRSQGIAHIDTLLVSHGDSDHSGGVNSVIEQIPVTQLLTSVPQRFTFSAKQLCHIGQSWRWDGVLFTILHPDHARQIVANNNSSCVLKIGERKNAILLTGDIEKSAEEEILQNQSDDLSAQILIAPHHGSRTSSSEQFVKAIDAKYVLFSVGYRNRFHFPNNAVVERYKKNGSICLDTARNGAITFQLDAQGNILAVKEYRKQRHIWNGKE